MNGKNANKQKMFKLDNVKFKDVLYIESLGIEREKLTCIVGKSGGGKTTFLKLLNNMYSYEQGSIKFKNREIRSYNPIDLRREVPMLPQNPEIFSGTIKDNFVLTQKYAEKCNKHKQHFEEILKRVGMENHNLSDDAEKLSGGEKQRIALARIMLLDPEILLLDEPSASLDDETEELIIKLVVDYIKNKNGTLVMVTHSKHIAQKYGEVVVTINDGIIEQIS